MPTSSLTPSDRSQRASIAAHSRWAGEDPVEGTARARAAGPGSDSYWIDHVDPERTLGTAERQRRASNAKTAHFKRMALASARARRRAAS